MKAPKVDIKGKEDIKIPDVNITEIVPGISEGKIDVNEPKVDVKASKEDVKAPKMDVKEPKIDMKALSVDVKAPKEKIQLKSCNLKNITSIRCHNDWVNSVSTFPSGNIISASGDKSIIIYDIHFNILQNIPNAHDRSITYVEIKDENNFITCSVDKSIKSWIKNNNEFKINKIIKNAHDDIIRKEIYCSNNNLISCSWDKTIKIWKENIIIMKILKY